MPVNIVKGLTHWPGMREPSPMSPLSAQDVSVIIPTHNRAQLLAQAIDSVLGQSSQPGEIVVIDDCSQDDTPEVLASYGSSINAVRTEANIERGAARNLGAHVATGGLLAFLDSDDTWHPDKLTRQLQYGAAKQPVITGLQIVDQFGRAVGRPYSPPEGSDPTVLVHNYYKNGAASAIVLPRQAFDDAGRFAEQRVYQGSEDWMFLVKLLWAGWPVGIVPDPLVHYRVHAGGSTQDPANLERSMWASCDWLDEHQAGQAGRAAARRSHAATSIARAHIAAGNWRRGFAWGWVALAHGTASVRLRSAARLFRTLARQVLRAGRRKPAT
jgi:GT2 family glycosyltransferase